MRKILFLLIFAPQLCFSQLTTHHVMRALNGSTFDVRTSMPNIPNGQILVGNASGIGTAVTMSGDATLSNTGALSLNPASAGYSKWTTTGANIYRSSFVGIGQTSPTYDLDIRGIKGIKLTTAAFGSVPDPGSVANDFVSLTPRGFDLTMDAQMISSPFTAPSLGVAVAVSRPQPAMVIKNAGSGAALLIADGEVGILNPSPIYPLDVTGDINLTGGIRISGTAASSAYLRGNGTKFVSSGLLPADLTQSGATSGQVLGWNGSAWTPTTVGTLVAEPANQLVYGTGTGIDSDPGFIINTATDRMGINTSAAPLAALHVGNRNNNPSTDAQVLVSRTMSTGGIAGHSFADGSDVANGESYNSFDARLDITANITGVNGHYAAFQSMPNIASGVTLLEHYGLYDRAANSGTINTYNAIRALGPAGTVGDYNGFNLTSVVANNATGFALQSLTGTTSATGLTISGVSSVGGVARGIQVTSVTGASARAIYTQGFNEFNTTASGDQNLLMFSRGSVGTGDNMGMVWEGGSGATKYYSNRFSSEFDATLRGDLVFEANQTGNSGLISLVENARLKYNGVLNVSTGFQIGNAAATGTYLRGNGTNYISSGLLPADLTQSSASTNDVLAWNGSIWAPATNTSESTSIGAFNNTGTSNGLSLSGSALSLHAATISTPGAVNTGQQTFTSGAGSKYFNGTGTAQISVDGNTDATEAGINFTQVGGADIMAQMQVNSSDVDNARFQLLIEDAGSYVPKLIIGSLNDQKGVQESGGLYEEVTNVTSSPYAVIYGDRNIYLDGATITVNLQAIGTSTGETKIGRVIYFFNDNATNVTITPNGSETIADAASLTLLPNTGVTLLAVTGTQWAIRD